MKKDIDRTMLEANFDALWVMGAMYNNPDMVYLTGIHHVSFADLFKVRSQEPIVFIYEDMEREEADRSGLQCHPYDQKYPLDSYLKKENGDMISALAARTCDALHSIGLTKGRVALSGFINIGNNLALIDKVRDLMPNLEITSLANKNPIRQARLTKTKEEVDRIRTMGKLTTSIVQRVADFLTAQTLKNGVMVDQTGHTVTVGKVKSLINLWLAELGAENPEETIFSAGRDAGIPHSTGDPNEALRAGVPIIFDIFPCEKGGGYFYDFTRTWCIDFAPPETLELHQQVLQVHQQILRELEAGEPFKAFQSRTCELFAAMGHATVEQQFGITEGYIHSIGHGIGLDVHESPFSGFSATDADVLAPGSVFTIEPGLYYPSRELGVRIEDTVYLNPEGKFEILADYPYDLVLPVSGKA